MKNGVTFWRRLLSILLAVLATGLLVYSSLAFGLKDSFSKSNIEDILRHIDWIAEYDKNATDAVNVGIMHLTNSAYTKNLYLTPDQLPEFFEETQVRKFVVEKLSAFANAFLYGGEASLDAKEIAGFLKPISSHIEFETGIRVTDQMLIDEVAVALGADVLTYRPNIRLWYPARSIIALIIGVLLLLISFVCGVTNKLLRKDLLLSSLTLAISVITISFSFFAASTLISGINRLIPGIITIGDSTLGIWISRTEELFSRRGTLSLLGLIPSIVVTILCIIDKQYVLMIRKHRES